MVFDHEGKVYEDVEAMCAAYYINPGTFNSRIRSKHWNLEQALLTPVGPNYRDNPRISTKEDAILRDNRNYKYASEHTGSSEDSNPVLHDIHKRVNPGPKYVWTDHKGNEYPSKKAMCHAYGISADLFKSRTCVMHWKKILATIHSKITKVILLSICLSCAVHTTLISLNSNVVWIQAGHWKMHLQCLQKLHIAKNIKVLAKELFNDQKRRVCLSGSSFLYHFWNQVPKNAPILIFSLIFLKPHSHRLM